MTTGASERVVVLAESEADGAVERAFDAVSTCRVASVSGESLTDEGLAEADALVVVDDPPAADGIEIYHRVRAAGFSLPVLLVGEAVTAERVERALKAGVTEYLAAWSDDRAAELDARVRAHVERPTLDGTVQAGRWEAIAGALAHDAKNPLNVVTGRLELVDVEETHSDAIKRSVRRVESLLGELSTVASVANPGDLEPVDIGEVATAGWRDVGGPADRLTVEDAVTVEADPECLAVLVDRLLENVVVHAGEDATVTVGESADGFYVADDGPGFPNGDDRLFEQGYGTAGGGEGYGLFVAATAAAAHGWDISAGPSADGGARVDVGPVTSW